MKQLIPISMILLTLSGQAPATDAIDEAVRNPARPAADRERDTNRKPAQVLTFLGISPGMTVLEMFAGGGYYTQILDRVVAPDGRVLAHNNNAYIALEGPQFEARFEGAGLPRVKRVVAEANDLQLEANSLDATLLILAYHDFFFASEEFDWPRVDEQAFLATLCAAMKPGAVLGIVDHVAEPGGDVSDIALRLHRIDPEKVKVDMTDSCFELDAESSVLRNPDDDLSTSAVAPPARGHTDRFVYRFVRRAE